MNGKYLVPWAREGTPLPGTRDVVLGEKLWTWLEEQVKAVDDDDDDEGEGVQTRST